MARKIILITICLSFILTSVLSAAIAKDSNNKYCFAAQKSIHSENFSTKIKNRNLDYSTAITAPPPSALPTIEVIAPTTADAYSTMLSSINIGGKSTCALTIVDISWTNDRGGSGACIGTDNWYANIALKPGANIIKVTIKDIKNNTATDTLTIFLTDGSAPTVYITSPTSSGTYTINSTNINISGAASDNTGIASVNWENSKGGSGICSGTSVWNVSSIPISTGTNVITITATDLNNNKSTASINVIYDIGSPVINITSPTSQSSYSSTNSVITLSGSASDISGISSIAWTNNKGGSGTCSGTSNWSSGSINLQPGNNEITIIATDLAGEKGYDTLSITYDNDIPQVSILTPTSNSTFFASESYLDLTGNASDIVGVTSVKWANSRGGSGDCIGSDNWAITAIPLKSGENIITISAYDATNKKGSDIITVTSDQSSPIINISSPTTYNIYNTINPKITIAGSASDDTGIIKLEWENTAGGSGICSGTNSWSSGEITLLDGNNTFTITATDKANRTTKENLLVVCDLSTPEISITSPSEDTYSTNKPSLSLSGTASSNYEISNIAWFTNTGLSGNVSGKDNWTTSNIPLTEGENVITVTVTTEKGSTKSDSITIKYYKSIPGNKWKGMTMVSLPIIPESNDPFTVVNFANNYWCSFDPISNQYYQYPQAQSLFNPIDKTPSRGFWSKSGDTIATPYGKLPDQEKPYSIHLKAGWNIIGNPFVSEVTWSTKSIQVKEAGKNAVKLESSLIVNSFLWGWQQDNINPNTGSYYLVCDSNLNPKASNKFESWKGYWIMAEKECDLIIPAP